MKFGYEEVDSGSTASKCPTCEQAWSLYSSESDDSDPGRSSQIQIDAKMDEHCKLQCGKIFKDFDCLLNFVDGKSDKFYRIQLLKNDKGFHVWTRWGRNVSDFDTL